MKRLLGAALPHGLLKDGEEWGLAAVRLECCNLGFQILANVDDGGDGRRRDVLAVGNEIRRRCVIQLLSAMGFQPTIELFWKAVALPGPLKRQRGEHSCHGVVGMTGDSSVRTVG